MANAPIILFVYNRPWHTEQTLRALRDNHLAAESTLYIYADGIKEDASEELIRNVNEVRRIIRARKWCGEVHIIERERNLGLADSVVEGVSETVNNFGRVIVLEDDIVTAPDFLQYMNWALNTFEHNDKVMQVSGFMIPHKFKLPANFLYRAPGSWGWATWKRAWKFYEHDTRKLLTAISSRDVSRFNIDDTYPNLEHLKMNDDGTLKTWGVRWYASIFLQNGLCLWPAKSYARNIGHDGSGENCSTKKDYFLTQELNTKLETGPVAEEESAAALELFKLYYGNKSLYLRYLNKRSLGRRVFDKLFKRPGS